MKRALLLLALMAGCILTGGSTRADEIKVYVAGGYEKIGAISDERVTYFSLSELAEIIGGSVTWDVVGHRITFSDGTFRFGFLLDSPYLTLNDSTFNMTYPARVQKGQLFLPVVTALPLLDRVTMEKMSWLPREQTIRLDSEFFNVTDLVVQSRNNGLLIEVYLTNALSYDAFVTEGNWLNISIRDARVNANRILSRKDSRYMYRLKVHQVENNTGQISLRLKRKIEKWHHKIVYDPPRIQVSIADVNFELDTGKSTPVIGPDEKIDVIVIDAGHGGEDNGAVGLGGTREKEISLGIAKRLAKLIRKDKQFKVIMTRDRDRTVSLNRRASIANNAGADLFVSIHANASVKRSVRGWNVFFLAPARNDSARAVEQLENSYFVRESHAFDNGDDDDPTTDPAYDPVLSILNEMLMTEFQSESHDYALMVDREFRRRLKTKARGVDQAGFFVLNKVFTPSVLIEAGFISNRQEEKLLRSKKYQEKIAKGLYESIKRFKAKYESN